LTVPKNSCLVQPGGMVTVSGPTVSGACAKTALLARRKATKQSPCRRCRVVMSGAPGWGFYCLIMVKCQTQSLLVDRRIWGFGPILQCLHVGLNSFKPIDAARSPVSSGKVLTGAKAGESVSKQSYGPNRRPIGLPHARMNFSGSSPEDCHLCLSQILPAPSS
jgi:hypothetical protein